MSSPWERVDIRARSAREGGPVLLDGATGTELQKLGLPLGESSELWNLSYPEVVEAVARSYREAGSRIVLTNTFQANPIALAARGAGALAVEVNRAGVALARAGAPGATIFGSVGPIGPRGNHRAEAVAEAYRVQTEALAVSGVEAIVLETFVDLGEAVRALRVAKATGLPVVVSFHFGPDGTVQGHAPEALGRVLREAGADAVGANCGDGPAPFVAICRRLREASGLPVWIKPNAGTPILEQGRALYPSTPEAFAESWPALVSAGASFVGGCCGVGPAFIQAMAARRDR